MPLQRLTPVIDRTALGHLRLSQDELAEIVRLVQLLPDADVMIESDNYRLYDVRAELPQIGKRVGYFTSR